MDSICRSLGALIFACSHVIGSGSAHAQAENVELEPQRDGVINVVSIRTPDFNGTAAGRLRWQKEIEQLGSRYLRLRFGDVSMSQAGEVVLSLRDRSGRLVRKYSAAELHQRSPLWSDVIPGGYVLVSLHADQPPVGFSLTIDRIAYQAYAGAALSTVGDDEKQPIAEYSGDAIISRVQRSIARLLFIQDGTSSTCTGFLIEPGRLMTNHHCVHSQDVCATMRAVFGYQYDESGLLQFGEQYECRNVVASSYELDYAVLEIADNPEEEWGTLQLGAGADPNGQDALFIVQHPAGEPKQISKINCAAGKVPVDGRGQDTDFTHTCDTVGGSSGSPVFDESGKVVGLHHYGFKDGGTWTENRAIRIKQITQVLGQ